MQQTPIPKLPAGALENIEIGEIRKLFDEFPVFKGEFRKEVREILEDKGTWEEYQEQLQNIPKERRSRREFQKGDFSGAVGSILEVTPDYFSLRPLEFERIKSYFKNMNMQVSITDLQENSVKLEFMQKYLRAQGFESLEKVFSGQDTEEKVRLRHYFLNSGHRYDTESMIYLNSIEGFLESEDYLGRIHYFARGDSSLLKRVFELYSVENGTDIDEFIENIGSLFMIELNRNGTDIFDYLISHFSISTKEDFLKLFHENQLSGIDIFKSDINILQFLFEKFNIQSIEDAEYMFNRKNISSLVFASFENLENLESIQKLIEICSANNIQDFYRVLKKYFLGLLRLSHQSEGLKAVLPLLQEIYGIETEDDLDTALLNKIFESMNRYAHFKTLKFFITRFNISTSEELEKLYSSEVGKSCITVIQDHRLIEKVFDIYGIHRLEDFLQHKLSKIDYENHEGKIIIGEGNVDLFLYLFDLYNIDTPERLEQWYHNGNHIDRSIKRYSFEVVQQVIALCEIQTSDELENWISRKLELFFMIPKDKFQKYQEEFGLYFAEDVSNKLDEFESAENPEDLEWLIALFNSQ